MIFANARSPTGAQILEFLLHDFEKNPGREPNRKPRLHECTTGARLGRRTVYATPSLRSSERVARGLSRVSAARARVTTVMADARATMERLARLAKAQVRFDPARRPEESGHPPIRRV